VRENSRANPSISGIPLIRTRFSSQSQDINREKRIGAFSEAFDAFRGWYEDSSRTLIVERCEANLIRAGMNVGTFSAWFLNGPMLPLKSSPFPWPFP